MSSHAPSSSSPLAPTRPVTPFRQAELVFKSRSKPPDLALAFSLESVSWSSDDTGYWQPPAGSPCRPQKIRRVGRGVGFESFPGLVVLPNYLAPSIQRALVRTALLVAAVAPNATSLDPHFELPEEGIWLAARNVHRQVLKKGDIQVALKTSAEADEELTNRRLSYDMSEPAAKVLSRLRWATIGHIYDWTRKIYLFDRASPLVPPLIAQTCQHIIADIDWGRVFGKAGEWDSWAEAYRAQAGLINFYHPKDTLTGHIDQAEMDVNSPLVSISLGLPAVFLIGGVSKDVPPLALLLKSGDVVVMANESRQAVHGVPRVLDHPVPEAMKTTPDDVAWTEDGFEAYMHSTRINCNVRQVQ